MTDPKVERRPPDPLVRCFSPAARGLRHQRARPALHPFGPAGPERQSPPRRTVWCRAVGIGPVTLPQYLDRPQIVERTGPNSLKIAEFDRWAEPLNNTVPRILVQNISQLLQSDRVYALPRRTTTCPWISPWKSKSISSNLWPTVAPP